jgi:iron-sulfur cluster assembly protein
MLDARDLLEQEIPDIDLQDIIVSDRARDRLLDLGYTDVEFSTEGGGCSGMNYILRPIEREINERDKVIKSGDLNLIVPFSSFVYLIGTEIDFSSDLLNGGFIFTNPQANRSCGCGTSFSV